jgi:hypothetical protein
LQPRRKSAEERVQKRKPLRRPSRERKKRKLKLMNAKNREKLRLKLEKLPNADLKRISEPHAACKVKAARSTHLKLDASYLMKLENYSKLEPLRATLHSHFLSTRKCNVGTCTYQKATMKKNSRLLHTHLHFHLVSRRCQNNRDNYERGRNKKKHQGKSHLY